MARIVARSQRSSRSAMTVARSKAKASPATIVVVGGGGAGGGGSWPPKSGLSDSGIGSPLLKRTSVHRLRPEGTEAAPSLAGEMGERYVRAGATAENERSPVVRAVVPALLNQLELRKPQRLRLVAGRDQMAVETDHQLRRGLVR